MKFYCFVLSSLILVDLHCNNYSFYFFLRLNVWRENFKRCFYVKRIILYVILDTFGELWKKIQKPPLHTTQVFCPFHPKNKVVFHRTLTSYSNPFGFKSLILLNQSILRNDRKVVRLHESIQILQILSKNTSIRNSVT